MDNTQSTAEQSAEELNILFPNQKIKIGDEELEVKEYTLIQQLQYRAKFMPFIATLRDTLSTTQANGEFDVDAVLDCIGTHYADVLALVALSVGKPTEYVQSLTGEEAETLLLVWWTVNADFFTRQAVRSLLEKLAQQNLKTLAGAKSLSS